MKIALYLLAGLAGLILMVLAIGYVMPESHSVSREQTFASAPESVFAVISAPADFPKWRSGVKQVELLPAANGKPRFRETGDDGSILYEVEELTPPDRLVTRIANPTLPFGGKWTFVLTPSGTGTTLQITEDGEIYNPLYRVMSKYVFGHASTIEKYMSELATRLDKQDMGN